ncbi:RRP15-like protein isoform X2 [Pararge aegeria]|uniref:RRP15-like protein isoform X2 n=1 Tax=Pararge aegeria TaxID=116150 RepID=UPI0019D0FF35|nr:RRP15-like protein isoform X2 [Pararge aegeria]
MVVAEEMSKPLLKVSVSDEGDDKTEPKSESSEDDDENESNKESDNDDDNNDDDDDDVIIRNAGWADSVSKILGSSKPKNKKTLVLSRAKKLADTIKKENEEKPTFEVVGDKATDLKTEVKKETSVSEPPAKKKRVEKSKIRIKPNILEKDRERILTKIATKGVVQLFNAVRNQQKTIEKEIKDIPEGKKEKVLKKFDKRAFLDTLMGQSKSVIVEEQTKTLKDEVKSESEKPRWNALRDDFMMGAKMKDWDKESVDE